MAVLGQKIVALDEPLDWAKKIGSMRTVQPTKSRYMEPYVSASTFMIFSLAQVAVSQFLRGNGILVSTNSSRSA